MPKHDPGEPEGFAIPMQRNRCNAVMSENGMVRAVLQPCHKAKLARGIEGKGARHVPETRQRNHRDRHRYRQEFVPHRRDAEAIAEAVPRPTMKFVATKTADQLDLQALHRCEAAIGACFDINANTAEPYAATGKGAAIGRIVILP